MYIISNIYIIVSLLLLCIVTISIGNKVNFKATRKIIRDLSDSNIKYESFIQWFDKPIRQLEILKLNPGIQSVEAIGTNKYRGYLSPIQFPGVSIMSRVDFDTSFDGKRLEVNCFDDSLVQDFQGSKILISLISKLLPKIQSSNILTINNDNYLINEATLNICFDLPNWFPFNRNTLEKQGSIAIGNNIDKDLNELLDRIIETYKKLNN